MYFFLKKNIESQKPSPKPPNLKSISPTKRENSNPNHESHYVKLFNNVLKKKGAWTKLNDDDTYKQYISDYFFVL
jgi:hypothetical protein